METNKPKKILIALDYGPTARKVAEAGFAITKNLNCEIILLHVIADPMQYSSLEYSPIMGFNGYPEMGPIKTDSVEELKNTSQHFLDISKKQLGDETIQTLIKEGDAAQSIIKTAKELHVDIIVMGSHSRKFLEKITMGSVTEKVINRTSIPLIIIPTKKTD